MSILKHLVVKQKTEAQIAEMQADYSGDWRDWLLAAAAWEKAGDLERARRLREFAEARAALEEMEDG